MQMNSLEQQLRREITRDDNNETVEVVMDCDCLPICTDLSYHSETSQTNWDWLKQYSASGGDTTNLTVEEYVKLRHCCRVFKFVFSGSTNLALRFFSNMASSSLLKGMNCTGRRHFWQILEDCWDSSQAFRYCR